MRLEKRVIMRALALASFVALSACASHKSPLQDPEGKQTLYLIQNEQDVFRSAYDALVTEVPNFPIEEIDGPIRGYQVVWSEWMDQYATMIRVYPGKGTTSLGEVVNGYYIEVSGRGSIFRGPSLDTAVYKNASQKLASLGRKVFVGRITRGKYKRDRDRWRLTSQPSLRDGGSITIKGQQTAPPSENNTISKRLLELENLKKNGQISDEEYLLLRKEILSNL